MSLITPARILQAANDNPGGSRTTTALFALIDLLARAEQQAILRKGAANAPEARTHIGGTL